MELPSWLAELPNWVWFAVAGLFGGMCLAHVIDSGLNTLKRWVLGHPTIRSHFSPKGGVVPKQW